jgi:hypothetical protein
MQINSDIERSFESQKLAAFFDLRSSAKICGCSAFLRASASLRCNLDFILCTPSRRIIRMPLRPLALKPQ